MRRPNLLWITTDRQRYDALGVNGNPALKTPNLDRLATTGCNFTAAYSEVPTCIPARRILLTGMCQERTGLVGYQDELEWDPPHTIPGLLSAAGYQTELVGKLHLWPHRRRYGFDHRVLADDLGERGENDYTAFLRAEGCHDRRVWMAHGCEANSWVARPWHLDERLHPTTFIADRAIDFLERRDPSVPFCLQVSFIQPHPPLTPPGHYLDRYLAMNLPEPVCGSWAPGVEPGPGQPLTGDVSLDAWTHHNARAGYYGLVNQIDDQVGRVINALIRMKLVNDTAVVFSSDHGEMLGDHHQWGIRHPYEPVLHILMILHLPRWLGYPQGVESAAPVGLQDIGATLLELAGVDAPGAVTGRSLLSLARGESDGWRRHLHCEHNWPGGRYAHQTLTDGRRKYIWLVESGQEQLFDLRSDPHELHDLAAVRPEELAGWRADLVEALRGRPEGFVAGEQLVAGRNYPAVLASA